MAASGLQVLVILRPSTIPLKGCLLAKSGFLLHLGLVRLRSAALFALDVHTL
jgi:hypothetical protein